MGLGELGLALPYSPQPWNLITNFFINKDGTFTVKAPKSKPGDYVVLQAEMDAYIVISACPQLHGTTPAAATRRIPGWRSGGSFAGGDRARWRD